MPRRCRSTFTRDTRRILASCSGVSGWASGSDSAAAMTSSSVMASIRAQSVLSVGRLSREWRTTLEVLFLLMSCCLPGAYDTANIFLWHDCYDEQDFSLIHTEALNSLLVVIEPVVKNFDLARIILKRPCCGREADTVLCEIRCRFGFIPFVFHMLDTTGYR